MGHKDFRSNLCEDTDLREIISRPNKKQSHEALAFLRLVTVKRFTEHPSYTSQENWNVFEDVQVSIINYWRVGGTEKLH